MGPSDAARLKGLEDENRRLKKLLAESMLDNAALKDLLSKKLRTSAARREAALRVMAEHGFSQRRACRLIEVDPKTVRRQPTADGPEVRQRLRELAGERRWFDYRRLGILLAREGMTMNQKKLLRLYREEGLAVRRGASGPPARALRWRSHRGRTSAGGSTSWPTPCPGVGGSGCWPWSTISRARHWLSQSTPRSAAPGSCGSWMR